MTALYRHYAQDGSLLYVGISCKPITRLKQHEHDSSWAVEIARVEVSRFESREAALKAEREAIQKERPKFNKVHARTRPEWKTVLWRFRGRRLTFDSPAELARFLRSCALAAQRGEIGESECAQLLRWAEKNWPDVWRRMTSSLQEFGSLTSGSLKTLMQRAGYREPSIAPENTP